MKKCILTFILALVVSPGLAQEQTFISGDVSHGGFGGPVVQLTSFDGQLGVMPGGHGGWIINHAVYIGLGGYGLVNEVEVDLAPDSTHYLNLGYGGFELGGIVASNRLIHFTVHSLFGIGGVDYRSSTWDGDFDIDTANDIFLVVEPTIQLELNVTRYFRVAMGAGYRYITNVELTGISSAFLSGPSGSATLKFGRF